MIILDGYLNDSACSFMNNPMVSQIFRNQLRLIPLGILLQPYYWKRMLISDIYNKYLVIVQSKPQRYIHMSPQGSKERFFCLSIRE